jgi:agmatinase
VRERGVDWLLEKLRPDESVFLSFDCDGVDPSVLPAVSALAPGGLDYPDAADLVAGIGRRLAGAVVTEYVPSLDQTGTSAAIVVRLLVRLLASLA